MKKLFVAVGFALLAFSCSSDDNNEFPTQGLSQYEVDFTAKKNEFRTQGELVFGSNLYPMHEDQKHYLTGLAGVQVIYYKEQTVAFDFKCPVEWSQKVGGGMLRTLDLYNWETKCDKCNSTYNFLSGEPVKGRAKGLGLKLVKYKVDYEPETGDCHITNPNYK